MKNLIMKVFLFVLIASSIQSVKLSPANAQTIVNNGESKYSIYYGKDASSEVALAAKEIQTYVKKVTGAQLPIVTTPKTPYISLGMNDLFNNAKIKDQLKDTILPDGFVMASKDNNIFIAGIDTPDNQVTTAAGFSRGTLFGAYTFIEKYLGVRWFMPGDVGEYVPQNTTIKLPSNLLIVENPSFMWRFVPYLDNEKAERREIVEKWELRNKLNRKAYNISLQHSHIWNAIFKPELYETHPEYFAMLNGQRVKPLGDRYKMCTTNPAVIKMHADAAIKYFDNNPNSRAFSLSLTDSRGYCECENCKALDEPNNASDGILSRRILTYYNEVAKQVIEKYPDRYVCGYIYDCYLYPPLDKSIKIAPNLNLVVAPNNNYGYTYYRENVPKEWKLIMDGWTALTTNISYYDLPMHCKGDFGAPLSTSSEILSSIMPALKKYKVEGLHIYGHHDWGHATPYNYLLTKLNWNADLNVNNLMDEFFSKCYGEGGNSIRKLYNLVDSEMKKYYLSNMEASYTLSADILKEVYAKNRIQIEEYYFEALANVKDENAKKRIEFLGENLKVMYDFLKTFGFDSAPSKLALTKEEFEDMRARSKESIYLPGLSAETEGISIDPSISVKPYKQPFKNASDLKVFTLRDSCHFIMLAPNDDVISIKFPELNLREKMITYMVYNSTGQEVASGAVSKAGDAISFIGTTGEYFHLFLNTSSTFYKMEMPKNIPYAVDTRNDNGQEQGKGLLFLGNTTPLYFYVGDNETQFSITLSTDSLPGNPSGGETAEVKLYDPDGLLTEKLSTVNATIDTKTIKTNKQGIWKMDIGQAEAGMVDDVFIRLDSAKLSGYVSFESDKLLIVEKKQ